MDKNTLYYGDNLDVLRRHIDDESVDLVYLDPPFKSSQDYNVLFAEQDGSRSSAQFKAFTDTWRWDEAAARAHEETVESGGKVSQVMQAFRTFLGTNDMLAYLSMMAPRLMELHRVLKPTGSIYLHCDPTASHYLKLLMDAVFGASQFLNEIVWKRSHAHSSAKRYGPIHDVILFYAKSDRYLWTDQRLAYSQEYVDRFFKFNDNDGRGLYWTGDLTANGVRNGETGKPWRGFNPTDKGRHWMVPPNKLDNLDEDQRIYWPKSKEAWPKLKRYISEARGVPLQDIFDDIYALMTMGGDKEERLGYPTQKPEALLERMIAASSNEEDTILDPFCGCGTTIAAAEKLNRRWIGIDITHLAIALIRNRLQDAFGDKVATTYKVIGEPTDLASARALALEDRYQFQWWAAGRVGARLIDKKKGADQGIDGRLFFHDDRKTGETKQIILSIKSGGLKADDVRALGHVVTREKARIGVLITLEEPTKPMRRDAASAGFYESSWKMPGEHQGSKHPRLQILTIEEILAGKGIDRPPHDGNVTFKRAPKVSMKKEEQARLL